MVSKIGSIMGILLIGLLAVGCDGTPKTVKVAASLPLSIDVGQDMRNAIELALEEAEGKAGDIAVELLVLDVSDPEGSPISVEKEAEAAAQATDDEAVVAYLGPVSSQQAKESMPILNEAGVVQISQAVTWPGLTKPGFAPGEPGVYYPTGVRHFFRVVPSDDQQGKAGARWMKALGFETVYLVDDGSAYGEGLAGIVALALEDLKLTVVDQEQFDDEATGEELEELASRIAEAQPDALYYSGGAAPLGDEFIAAVRAQAPELPIMMGGDGIIQDEIIDAGAEAVEGIYATQVVIPVDKQPFAADFVQRYETTYGEPPSPYTASSYEAMKVLLHAIEQAETPTREGVLDAVGNLGEFSGVLGEWHFEATGDISPTTISGMQIQDGAWTFVEIIQ